MSINYCHELIDELRRTPADKLPAAALSVRLALVAGGKSEAAARLLVNFAIKHRDRDVEAKS